MTKDKALRLALEALELHGAAYLHHELRYEEAITTAKEALAQPSDSVEQEPFTYYDPVRDAIRPFKADGDIPLYTAPPKRKPLTDEQQIAEALRRHGLTLVKTAKGYDVMSLGQITAHGITKESK